MNLVNLVAYFILVWLPSAESEAVTSGFRPGGEKDVFFPLKNIALSTKKSNESANLSRNDLQTPTGRRVASHDEYQFRNGAKNKMEKGTRLLAKVTVVKNAHRVARILASTRSSALINDNNSYVNSVISGKMTSEEEEDEGEATSASNTHVTYDRLEKREVGRKLSANVPSTTESSDKAEDKTTTKTTAFKVTNYQVSTLPQDYDEEMNESKQANRSELGRYLGGPCERTCSEKLIHVVCDEKKRICECEEKYPVEIGAERGCEKPNQLGDQCFYEETCSFFDSNAECAQINHNAICQCKPGYHTVALRKGVKRMFCSEDVIVVSADLPTLLGVATGIAVLTGLLCFVLRLFSGNRYPAMRHYGNANLTPPLLFSSGNQWINGIPLTVQGRSSSRSSCQRSTASLGQYPRNKGVLVPASRAGAARAAAILLIPCHLQASRHSDTEADNEEVGGRENAVESFSRIGSRRHSLTSVHSTASSQKSMSYSARRFELENQQREQRAAMKAAREEAARLAALPTPSPCSTEDVLLINTSTNNEEDFLCSNTTDAPARSEPPALLFKKVNAEEPPTSETVSTALNNTD